MENVVSGKRWAEDTDPHKPPRPSAPIPGLLSYDEYVRRQQEWDEIQQQMRLFGLFYEGGEAFMYPAAWLMNSERLHKQLLESEVERKVEALGIDVAAGGGDETVWTFADQHGIIEQVGMHLSDTMEIAGRTVRYIRQHKLAGKQVAIDAGGGGKQISDRIRELVMEHPDSSNLVFVALGRRLGLVAQ